MVLVGSHILSIVILTPRRVGYGRFKESFTYRRTVRWLGPGRSPAGRQRTSESVQCRADSAACRPCWGSNAGAARRPCRTWRCTVTTSTTASRHSPRPRSHTRSPHLHNAIISVLTLHQIQREKCQPMAPESLYSQLQERGGNRWVFSVVLNVRRYFDDVTTDGRLFQVLAAVTWNARSLTNSYSLLATAST